MLEAFSKNIDKSTLFIKKIKHLLIWIKRKTELNEVYFFQNTQDKSKPYVMIGEIYYADLGTNVGAEIDKQRPVLIFQNDDRYIRQSNLVFIFPISTNIKPNPYKVIIKPKDITDNDGICVSSIIIQQAKSISKNRLFKYKGKLSDIKLVEILYKFNRFIYKNNPFLAEGDAQTIHGLDTAKSVI